ncbi:MAG: LamG domain-containing protein [Bacteroidales bacterium]|nr:LamG domain-containing protein [Bacteroidales bacterium]
MKPASILLTVITVAACIFLHRPAEAQVPEKMSYQAVVRNSSDQLVTNANIGMQISIFQGSTDGAAVYVERHFPVTNANGLVTVEIGGGTVISGIFDSVDWKNGPYFIRTETDPAGDANYTITSTSQLLSVPYAFYAKTSGNGFSGNYNDLTNKPELFNGSFSDLADKPTTTTGYGITDAVSITGDQDINGNKTFTGTIKVPTPVDATDAATKAYVDVLIAQAEAMHQLYSDAWYVEAYYTRYTDPANVQPWEEYSRTGDYPDIVVRLSKFDDGQMVFWRGNSYLPFWKTSYGQWNFTEKVTRTGDGTGSMPDRVNTYSHVRIIENTASKVIIHWRYLSFFKEGNPHDSVNPRNFVDEVFTITPDGLINRVIKQATEKIDDWNDPLNQTTESLKLTPEGINKNDSIGPSHSVVLLSVDGNPVRDSAVVAPVLWYKFDEAVGDSAKDCVSNVSTVVQGHKTLWKKGVSGTALQFDGYNSVVSLPAAHAPIIKDGDLTLEAWIALGAYPWNWVPIVQQGDDDGYFLGVDSHGCMGFRVKIGNILYKIEVFDVPPYTGAGENHISLFKWYHVAGTYEKELGRMCFYLNGRNIGCRSCANLGVNIVNDDIRIGKAGIMRIPTEDFNKPFSIRCYFGFDGLIDEVKIYNVALDAGQIESSYQNFNPGEAIVNNPNMQKRELPDTNTNNQFKAIHTLLPYYETWDNMWRFGPFTDVVIGFDQLPIPIRYVFWHGASYIPMIVNDSNQWYTNASVETGLTDRDPGNQCEYFRPYPNDNDDAPGDCEPIADKGCWNSHVRIIENTLARVVVHWRYRLANQNHQWAFYDSTTGWGDMVDCYYYIFPDGVATKRMRCYSSSPYSWHEWNENMAVLSEGQHPKNIVGKDEPIITLVNCYGESFPYNWIIDTIPPKPEFAGKVIQMIHFTGQYDPFIIQKYNGGEIVAKVEEQHQWYAVTPVWNHWPTAQIKSETRCVSFSDRAAHTSISKLCWPVYLEYWKSSVHIKEKILLEGITNKDAKSLVGLARSWIYPPSVCNVSGGISHGYDTAQRAYVFTMDSAQLSFRINGHVDYPIENLCFVIKRWDSRTSDAKLNVIQNHGQEYSQGIIVDTDGTYTKILWVPMSATSVRDFFIDRAPPAK